MSQHDDGVRLRHMLDAAPMDPRELLERGVKPLVPFFERLGFHFVFLAEVMGSGGRAAQGEFRRGNCFVRLHERFLVPMLSDPEEMRRVLSMPTPQRKSRLP